jgi:hypothetical protein
MQKIIALTIAIGLTANAQRIETEKSDVTLRSGAGLPSLARRRTSGHFRSMIHGIERFHQEGNGRSGGGVKPRSAENSVAVGWTTARWARRKSLSAAPDLQQGACDRTPMQAGQHLGDCVALGSGAARTF